MKSHINWIPVEIVNFLISLFENNFLIVVTQGCIKAGFFIKSPAGRLKLVKTGFYWSKLAEIFSKQISQNGTDKFNYCNQEHNVKQHNH